MVRTSHANLFPMYGYLPGALRQARRGLCLADSGRLPPSGGRLGRPNLQYVRDRFGKILTPQEIFSEYDPGVPS
jgi:hypothetical protein